MTDKKISDLTATTLLASTDLFELAQDAGGGLFVSKKIAFSDVKAGGGLATKTGTETLTNKTLTSPVIGTISNTGTLTLPTSTDTLVGRATTDTLTNKTISAATLSGTTSVTGLIDASASGAGQIKFPATANLSSNANTLDDFEEGTFTSTFGASTGTYTPTYGNQVGWYRKVASQVTVGGVVSTTAFTGTPTGRMSIGGLPFTCTSTSNAGIAVSAQLMDSSINHLIANMSVSTATIALFKFAAGAPSDIGSVFTQTQNVQFGGSYITAS